MIGDLIAGLLGVVIVDTVTDRVVRRRIERLHRDGILLGAVRGVDADLGRFGREWLSSEWHVSPGRVHVGSTTVRVDSIDESVRLATAGDFSLMLPAGMEAVVVTVRGPGPVVEIAMAAESEKWFREAVARDH